MFFFLAENFEVYDNTLRLVQGNGVQGRIWITGCVSYDCWRDSYITLTMKVRNRKHTRVKTIKLNQAPRPLLVNELLKLKRGEKNVSVEVLIRFHNESDQLLLEGKDFFRLQSFLISTYNLWQRKNSLLSRITC